MGTYMTGYIEVDLGDEEPFSDPFKFHSLTEGSFIFSKDYDVFDALAWGRDGSMDPEDRNPDKLPLIHPRGVPAFCSVPVARDYYYLITGPPMLKLPSPQAWPGHRLVSPELASDWVREKRSCEAEIILPYLTPGKSVWRAVSAPGLYNPSWLSGEEFDAALAQHRLELKRLPTIYRIIRYSLFELAEKHGLQRVRLVVWFG